MNEEEELKKLEEELAAEEAKEALEKRNEAIREASEVNSKYANNTKTQFGTASNAVKDSSNVISDHTKKATAAVIGAGAAVVKTGKEAIAGNKDLLSATSEISKHMTAAAFAFNNYTKSVADDTRSTTKESINDIKNMINESGKNLPGSGILSKLGSGSTLRFLSGQMEDIMESADGIENYRTSLMELAATRGDLNKFFSGVGENFENVGNYLKADVATNIELSKSLGLSIKQVEDLNKKFGEIPGTLGETIKVGGNAVKTMSLLEGAVNLARGSGRSFTEVQAEVNVALNEFGFSAQKAIEYSSRIAEVSKVGNMPLSVAKGLIHDISNTYRLYGNNVDAASKMSLKFYDNLRQSGVSAKDSQNIITGFSNSVEKLSLAQKSFLSAQTGGPGGLLGGIQIEKMLSEGKMDEVFDKVKSTLQKQFNGKIMTLGDVKTQEDASVFTKQRTLLRQGPLGNIVGSDAEASKVLESFKRGEKSVLSGENKPQLAKDASDSLVGPIEKGNEIGLRGNNILLDMKRALEIEFKKRGFSKGLEGIGTMTGGASPTDTPELTEMKKDIRDRQSTARVLAGKRVSRQKEGKPEPIGDLSELIDVKELGSRVLHQTKAFRETIKNNVTTTNTQAEPNKNHTTPSIPPHPSKHANATTQRGINTVTGTIPANDDKMKEAAIAARHAARHAVATTNNTTNTTNTANKSVAKVINKEKPADVDALTAELQKRYGQEVKKQSEENKLPVVAERGASTALKVAKQSKDTDKSPTPANKEQSPQAAEFKHSIEIDISGHCKVCGKQELISKNVLALNPAAGIGKNLK